MCGIAGRILTRPGDVGADLVDLMEAQRHRGADSTGFAVYGEPLETGFIVRAMGAEAIRALGREPDVVVQFCYVFLGLWVHRALRDRGAARGSLNAWHAQRGPALGTSATSGLRPRGFRRLLKGDRHRVV